MITLGSCPKAYHKDLDKACSPQETVARVKQALARSGRSILAENRRIDTGRLGIPVYMSICGDDARAVMPGRKQMGKGTSPQQAEASALMELMERYGFFTFWNQQSHFTSMTWNQAVEAFGQDLMPIEEIIHSVSDTCTPRQAAATLDLVPWQFCHVLDLNSGRQVMAPLDWFRQLNEYNGSSAGNTDAESILQATCELVERHVSAIADRDHPVLPTISVEDHDDPVLVELLNKFVAQGIKVFLKDMTCGMPLPTVAALAYDPATFPHQSEIVFTAGTATSPAKAAIRALTEVAQLAGDFESKTTYEPSGLSKYNHLEDIAWITKGPDCTLDDLPHMASRDIAQELQQVVQALGRRGFTVYSVATTLPDLGIPTHYTFIPGFAFRERTPHASIGMLTGKKIVATAPPNEAPDKLDRLEELFPNAHFLPFYRAQLAMNQGDFARAQNLFAFSEEVQPDDETRALSAFYQGHCLTLQEQWAEAIPHLKRAISLDDEVKEYHNLYGVCLFKLDAFDMAAPCFQKALSLDAGSAMDMANLGLCHAKTGKTSEAITCLQEAVTMDPSIEFAWKYLVDLTSRQ
jgi:ribosomal protein S12 methylthiotransferase accessory factor